MNNRYFIINVDDCFLQLCHGIRKVRQAAIYDGGWEFGQGFAPIRLQVGNDLSEMRCHCRVRLRRSRERVHDRINLRGQHMGLNHQVIKFNDMPLS